MCVCVVCMCIVYTTTLLSDVERRSAFRRTLYTVSMCVCMCVSEVCSYSMCILHTYTVYVHVCTTYISVSMSVCMQCVLPLHSSHSPTEHVHTYKNVSVSQYGGNINNTFLEQKPTPCVFVR